MHNIHLLARGREKEGSSIRYAYERRVAEEKKRKCLLTEKKVRGKKKKRRMTMMRERKGISEVQRRGRWSLYRLCCNKPNSLLKLSLRNSIVNILLRYAHLCRSYVQRCTTTTFLMLIFQLANCLRLLFFDRNSWYFNDRSFSPFFPTSYPSNITREFLLIVTIKYKGFRCFFSIHSREEEPHVDSHLRILYFHGRKNSFLNRIPSRHQVGQEETMADEQKA